jgi:phospholipid-binding lipoprotein MlaA
MKCNILIVSTILLWGGCSNKSDTIVKDTQRYSISKKSFDDEFENEFKDTMEVYDPFIGYNRIMTSFNDYLYIYAYNPISKGYMFVVPEIGRIGISNFFDNLKFPINFTNNILQLKFDHAIKELARFMINSTIGIVGFVDLALYAGIEPHREDFGQTLGYYGVGSGFHLVLPFLGASNLRDTLSFSVDIYTSPISYTTQPYQIPRNFEEAMLLKTGYYINKNSLHLGEYESIKKDALDNYLFFRDMYEQKRNREIEE